MLYYLFWILFSSQIDWEARLFVSDSERGSKTPDYREQCAEKETFDPNIPWSEVIKVSKAQSDIEWNSTGPQAGTVAAWPL